jgi:hypothetical protein
MMARWILALAIVVAALGAAAPAQAELYDVRVTRIVQNAYLMQSSRLVIITRMGLELALGTEAVLRYERGATNNRLLFDSGSACDVAGVYRPNAVLRRVDQDRYRDQNSGGYLETQYCYVYAYGEDALVLTTRVLFMDSRQECQVL